MELNTANLRSLYVGFSTAFQAGFAGVPSQYQRVALTVPSATKAQEYGWLGQFPRMREWIGDRLVRNLGTHGYAIPNRKFETTVGVNRDDIEDDNIGIFGPMFQEMGRQSASFPDELVWALLPAGFNTPCFDRQYFFDTDHPVLDENGAVTSFANTDGGSGTPWYLMDTSRAIKPIIYQTRRAFDFRRMDALTDEVVFNRDEYRYGVDGRCNVGFGFPQLAWGSKQTLDPTHYEAARVALASMKGDYGKPLGIQGNLLVVPPSLEGAGRKILQNKLVNGGEDNPWAGTAELLVVPWLA